MSIDFHIVAKRGKDKKCASILQPPSRYVHYLMSLKLYVIETYFHWLSLQFSVEERPVFDSEGWCVGRVQYNEGDERICELKSWIKQMREDGDVICCEFW